MLKMAAPIIFMLKSQVNTKTIAQMKKTSNYFNYIYKKKLNM